MPTWEFEPGHTSATFADKAVGMAKAVSVSGISIGGTDAGNYNLLNTTASAIADIDAASFSTAEPERDAHLRSADFLDVANYPTITFKSTSVEPTGTNHSKVTGDLTIRGVTRPVILEVEYFGPVDTPFNNRRMGYLARTRINREDFGCSWNSPMPGGGWVVGKEVEITIDVEGILVP